MPSPPNTNAWEELRAQQELQEHRFQSRVPVLGPLIVALRSRWNSIVPHSGHLDHRFSGTSRREKSELSLGRT